MQGSLNKKTSSELFFHTHVQSEIQNVRHLQETEQEIFKRSKTTNNVKKRAVLYRPSKQILRQRGLSQNKNEREEQTYDEKPKEARNGLRDSMAYRGMESKSTNQITKKYNSNLHWLKDCQPGTTDALKCLNQIMMEISDINPNPHKTMKKIDTIDFEPNSIGKSGFASIKDRQTTFLKNNNKMNEEKKETSKPLAKEPNKDFIFNFDERIQMKEIMKEDIYSPLYNFRKKESLNYQLSNQMSNLNSLRDNHLYSEASFHFKSKKLDNSSLPDELNEKFKSVNSNEDHSFLESLTKNAYYQDKKYERLFNGVRMSESNLLEQSIDHNNWDRLMSLNYNYGDDVATNKRAHDMFYAEENRFSDIISYDNNDYLGNIGNNTVTDMAGYNSFQTPVNIESDRDLESIDMFGQKKIPKYESHNNFKSIGQSDNTKMLMSHPFDKFDSDSDEDDSFYENSQVYGEDDISNSKSNTEDNAEMIRQEEEDDYPSHIQSEKNENIFLKKKKTNFSDFADYKPKYIEDNYINVELSEDDEYFHRQDQEQSKVMLMTNNHSGNISERLLESLLKDQPKDYQQSSNR